MLNNVCFSRSKTKDDTTSIKSKGRFHFKYVVIFFIKSTLHFISWWVWRRMSEQSQNNRSSGWRWRWRVPLVFLVSSFHNSVKKGMREQLPGMIARFIVLFWLGSPSYPLVSQMREWKKRSCFIFWVSAGFDTQASMKWTWCWFKVFLSWIFDLLREKHVGREKHGEVVSGFGRRVLWAGRLGRVTPMLLLINSPSYHICKRRPL